MPLGYSLALPLGGGPDDIQVEQDALLEALKKGLDPAAPEQLAQTLGEALAIANVWAADRRLSGQLDPHRMLETLPIWELACDLRPDPAATEDARRDDLAAQFLGLAGNAITDLFGICVAVAGASFLGFYIPAASAPTYTEGLLPGPPGWEEASCRAMLSVRLTPVGSADAPFLDLIRTLTRRLSLACPSWMDFVIGTDEGHAIVDVAIADLTLVMD